MMFLAVAWPPCRLRMDTFHGPGSISRVVHHQRHIRPSYRKASNSDREHMAVAISEAVIASQQHEVPLQTMASLKSF